MASARRAAAVGVLVLAALALAGCAPGALAEPAIPSASPSPTSTPDPAPAADPTAAPDPEPSAAPTASEPEPTTYVSTDGAVSFGVPDGWTTREEQFSYGSPTAVASSSRRSRSTTRTAG